MAPIICRFWPLDVQRAVTALRPTLLHPADRVHQTLKLVSSCLTQYAYHYQWFPSKCGENHYVSPYFEENSR